MRSLVVVVADELGQHRRQVPLVEHDHVVETLSAQRSNDTFGDRIRAR